MKKKIIMILFVFLILLSSVFVYLKISSKNITIEYNNEVTKFKSTTDKETIKFINEIKTNIEEDIKQDYNFTKITINDKLEEIGENKYKLIIDGDFTFDDTIIIEDHELEISETEFINKSNIISFTYTDSIEYNLDNKSKIIIGMKNNDIVKENYSIAANQNSLTAVINKKRRFTNDYVPENLTNITVSSQKSGNNNKIRSDILPNLETMFSDAKSQGVNLTVTSAYRSYDTQSKLFNDYSAQYGENEAAKFSAYAGASEHQTGLVVDIGSLTNMSYNFEEEFETTTEGIWLKENAYKYGFILRYPKGKEDITTYIYEPWHFRYVGQDLANYLYTNNLTLEEYFKLT